MAHLHPNTVQKVQSVLHGSWAGGHGTANPHGQFRPPSNTPPPSGVRSTFSYGNPFQQVTHPTPPPAAPYLTPGQQAAITQYDTTYTGQRAALMQQSSDAAYNTQQGLATNQLQHDVSTNNANQSTAARGLFQSSIRAGDLNDIDSTLTMRNNILNTNLQSLQTSIGTQLGTLDTNFATQHNLYNQYAVANAQAIPPIPGTPSNTPAAPNQNASTGRPGRVTQLGGRNNGRSSGSGSQNGGRQNAGNGGWRGGWGSGQMPGGGNPPDQVQSGY